MDLKMKTCLLLILSATLFLSSFTLRGEPQSTQIHKVEPGETAFSIAKAHNISLKDLYALNPGAENGVKAGTLLTLPQSGVANTSDEKYVYHTIERKETLYSVSRKYSVSVQDIMDANAGLTADAFQEGKVIRIPTDVIQKPEIVVTYRLHKVQKGETIYSIARTYNVSSTAISNANPNINTSALKKGLMIKIPLYSEKKLTETDILDQENKANRLLNERTQVKAVNSVKIGLLFPFSDENDKQSSRFIEYLEGFLLSVEDFKQKGYSAEVYVFDIGSGETTTRLESLLETEELRSLNVLIGGVSQSQIQLLSDFAKKRKVHYVIPFSSKNDDALSSNYVFQINTPYDRLYPAICEAFITRFKSSNVIFVNDANNDESDFVKALKPYLDKAQISNTSIDLSNDLTSGLPAFLSTTKNNLFIPTSASASTLNKLFSTLQFVQKSSSEVQVSLFGYPEWQAFNSQTQNNLRKFDSYFYSSFYVDDSQSDATLFSRKFLEYYGKGMMNVYPKYGLLGYDTGNYFLNAVKHYGQNFGNHLSGFKTNTIQLAINFKRINSWSGFINTGFYFVHPGASFSQKRDYSK